MNPPTITTASVRVMRSCDYCHFEVTLGTSEATDAAGVDALRKEAARLADKAVRQYQVAKCNAQRLLMETDERERNVRRADRIREKADTDRTVEEQAFLKAFDDAEWQASRRYDYEDEWDHERECDF